MKTLQNFSLGLKYDMLFGKRFERENHILINAEQQVKREDRENNFELGK